MNPRAFPAQRPLVCWAAAFGCGIALCRLWAGFVLWLPVAGFLISLAGALLLPHKTLLRFGAVSLAFFFLGALLFGVKAHPQLPPEGKYEVQGRVTGESVLAADDQRVKTVLRDVTLKDMDGHMAQVPRAYWTYYPLEDAALPLDGQWAQFAGQVYHPQGQVNPYGFDFRFHLLKQGIPLGISGARELILEPSSQLTPANPFLRARQVLLARIQVLFGEQAGLASALLLGIKTDLDQEITQDFQIAGIAHVLAVSGLHVGILAAFLLLITKPFHLSPRTRLLVLSAILLAYCALLDFRPSVLRASILFIILLSGRLFKRRADPLTSLAAAFFIILLIRPLDLFGLGFQLSFLAVLGIITLGDRFSAGLRRFSWFRRLPKLLQNALLAYGTTLAASLATFVPLSNVFHRVSLIGLLISPIAIVMIGLLMAGFLGVLLVSFVHLPTALLAAAPLKLLTRGYLLGVTFFAKLPYASLRLPYISPAAAGLIYLLMLISTRYVAWKPKFKLITAGVLCSLLALTPLLPQDQSLRYVQFSAGFADSAVIVDGDTTFVIDTGEHAGDVVNYLAAHNRRVNHLIITHLHRDHAGGLEQLLGSNIPIEEILLPYGALTARDIDECLPLILQAEQMGIPLRSLGAGDILESKHTKAAVTWPVTEALYPGMAANHGSLVLYWELDGVSMLTTGDISAAYAPYALRTAQVLKVPHHGSRADNSRDSLGLVSPQLALITASAHQADRYKMAQWHLDDISAFTLSTGDTGAITLRFSNGQVHIKTHLSLED